MVERIILKRVKDSKELVLDMVSTPDYVLKSVDWGTIAGTHSTSKYVNQVGATLTRTSLEVRNISIEGWIVATTSEGITLLKKNLNSFINPQDEMELHYNDYKISFFSDDTIKYANEEEENNDAFCKFIINGICPNPLFTNINESVSIFTTTTPKFHFPLIIPNGEGIIFGEKSDMTSTIINNGDIPSGMRIVFKANGSVQNPQLINVNTQEKFILNKTLVEDEEVEINTNAGEKNIKGRIGNAPYTNYYMYKDFDSSWLQLDVGDNLFRYDADAGAENLEIIVYFQNKFLEVQECY